jgi:hypothetical protein
MVKNMQSQMNEMAKTIRWQGEKIQDMESRGAGAGAAADGAAVGPAAPMSDYEFNNYLDTATGGAQKWLKNLKFSGDFRLRYEAFDYGSGNPAETDDRNRFRMRLRFGWEKTFSDEMMVGFGLASGEGSGGTGGINTDPTSTNATFDNLFNFKQINIEKAYATYKPSFLANRGILKKSELTGGKFNNPFEKGSSDMIWDRDVKPEGIYEKFDFDLLQGDNLDLTAYSTFGQFILDEDAAVKGDSFLFAYQVGLNPTVYTPIFEKPVDFLTSFSFYNYNNYARRSNFIIGGTSLARGNINSDSLATELDAGKFNILESYNEMALPLIVPTRVFFDVAGNPSDAADGFNGNSVEHSGMDSDLAFALGAKLGSIVKKGDWEGSYTYKRIGANSVVGAFSDSDFGDGHAGKEGSVIKAGYALTDNLTLNSTMFFVNNLNSGTAGIIDQHQRRFQVDMVWKF